MAEIVILAKDQSGLYAKITVALVRAGIQIAGRSVEKVGTDISRYVLSIDALTNKTQLAIEQIRTLEGIVEVESTSAHQHTHSPVQDWDIVDNLKQAYPDIVGIVRQFTASLKEDNARERLYGIGYEVGMFTNGAEMANRPASLTVACDEYIIPAISDYCFAERRKGNLVIALCPFCRDSPPHIHNCNFLHGVISGSIGSFPGWSDIKVSEVSSQAGGADECVFNFNV